MAAVLPLRLRLRVLLGPGSRPDTSPLVRSAVCERIEKDEWQGRRCKSEVALRHALGTCPLSLLPELRLTRRFASKVVRAATEEQARSARRRARV